MTKRINLNHKVVASLAMAKKTHSVILPKIPMSLAIQMILLVMVKTMVLMTNTVLVHKVPIPMKMLMKIPMSLAIPILVMSLAIQILVMSLAIQMVIQVVILSQVLITMTIKAIQMPLVQPNAVLNRMSIDSVMNPAVIITTILYHR